MHALALAGFIPSIPLPLEMVSVLRLFDRLSREVDVFVRYYIPFAELWSNSETVRVGNQMARIAALEHVHAGKANPESTARSCRHRGTHAHEKRRG